MNVPELTQEQRDAIYAQELKKRQSEGQRLDDDRKAWKELSLETADTVGAMLYESFLALSSTKRLAYESSKEALELKIELFGEKKKQQSHTLTGNKYRIILGRNATDGHDDTMESGIAKCEQYVESLIESETKKETIVVLNGLLKGDRDQKMDSKRIIELTKYASELNNAVFTDGVKIIQEAYEKNLTSYYVKLEVKNEFGGWRKCPLSLAGAPFPEGFTTPLFNQKEE